MSKSKKIKKGHDVVDESLQGDRVPRLSPLLDDGGYYSQISKHLFASTTYPKPQPQKLLNAHGKVMASVSQEEIPPDWTPNDISAYAALKTKRKKCAIEGCTPKSWPIAKSYHSLPSGKRYYSWVDAIRHSKGDPNWFPSLGEHTLICSRHFNDAELISYSNSNRTRLSHKAIPFKYIDPPEESEKLGGTYDTEKKGRKLPIILEKRAPTLTNGIEDTNKRTRKSSETVTSSCSPKDKEFFNWTTRNQELMQELEKTLLPDTACEDVAFPLDLNEADAIDPLQFLEIEQRQSDFLPRPRPLGLFPLPPPKLSPQPRPRLPPGLPRIPACTDIFPVDITTTIQKTKVDERKPPKLVSRPQKVTPCEMPTLILGPTTPKKRKLVKAKQEPIAVTVGAYFQDKNQEEIKKTLNGLLDADCKQIVAETEQLMKNISEKHGVSLNAVKILWEQRAVIFGED